MDTKIPLPFSSPLFNGSVTTLSMGTTILSSRALPLSLFLPLFSGIILHLSVIVCRERERWASVGGRTRRGIRGNELRSSLSSCHVRKKPAFPEWAWLTHSLLLSLSLSSPISFWINADETYGFFLNTVLERKLLRLTIPVLHRRRRHP